MFLGSFSAETLHSILSKVELFFVFCMLKANSGIDQLRFYSIFESIHNGTLQTLTCSL